MMNSSCPLSRLDRDDLGHRLLDGQPGADHLLVVVEELDPQVLVRVGPAQQRVSLLQLVVGQREGGVLVELDVLAVEDEGLAGRALAFLAAVHEHDSLLRRGTQDVLVLTDLDVDPDGLEVDDVAVGHGLPRTLSDGPSWSDGRSRSDEKTVWRKDGLAGRPSGGETV